MPERLKNTMVVAVLTVMAAATAALVFTAEAPADRVERIGSSIKCPVCQGEAIADSPSPMATDMMDLVSQRVEEGASDEEIFDELLGSFSGAVLLDPPASGATLILWLAPVAALGLGLVVVLWWRAHPGDPDRRDATSGPSSRVLIGGLGILAGVAAVIVVAAALIQEPATANEGAAEVDGTNLENASNETMEAVIAANLEHPEIDGMRIALAERYFEAGDYRAAFPHYLAVAESGTASDAQVTTALVRLGWMAYDGNGEVATAVTLFDEALAISPGSHVALYLKGQVLWCGAGRLAEAGDLFRQILDDPATSEETRDQVEQDLESVNAGEACA